MGSLWKFFWVRYLFFEFFFPNFENLNLKLLEAGKIFSVIFFLILKLKIFF